jgi:hypothetical protein
MVGKDLMEEDENSLAGISQAGRVGLFFEARFIRRKLETVNL